MIVKKQIQTFAHYGVLINLALTGVFLVGLQYKPEGWIFFLIGCLFLLFSETAFRKDITLIFLSVGILGFTPITTDISISHMIIMGTMLILAVGIPYLVSRYIYKTNSITYQAALMRHWTRGEWMWLGFALVLGYFLIPYYLTDSGSYMNWTVNPGWWQITLLFIGTNALGIWDELFFVNSVLALLRRHFDFHIANITQAILFTSFLYELGFRGWGPYIIFPFALAQGYVFRETRNLAYVITLHLALDLILFLALIGLHHPDWVVAKLFF